MKNRNFRFSLFVALFAGLMCLWSVPPVQAQDAGLYTAVSGGTLVLPSGSTNTVWVYALTNGVQNGVITTNRYGLPGTSSNLTLNVSDYDYAGLTFGLTGTATSTNSLLIYKSFNNGTTYESVASFQYLNIAPGAAAYATNASLDIHGVSRLAFVLQSSGTTFGTNILLQMNFKAPVLQTIGRTPGGKTPGSPILVPGWSTNWGF